jgi:mono/diheme cytochrome c family protein
MIEARSGRMIGLLIVSVAGIAGIASCSPSRPSITSEAEIRQSSSQDEMLHQAANPTKGKILYDASCIVCHGADATGGVGPRLAGNPVLSNDKLFWDRVLKGEHIMPPLAGSLTAQQIADIQAWLKSLR